MSRLAERIRNTQPWCAALLKVPVIEYDFEDPKKLRKQAEHAASQPFKFLWRPGFVIKMREKFVMLGEVCEGDVTVTVRQETTGPQVHFWDCRDREVAQLHLQEDDLIGSVPPVITESMVDEQLLKFPEFPKDDPLSDMPYIRKTVRDFLFRRAAHLQVQLGICYALLNCKGVRLEELQNSKKKRSKGKDKRQVESYWVLDIPGAPRYWERPTTEATGIQHRLHVVRGRFNHYTEEKPHVSGWVGPMWISSHARGNAELGLVEKDYNLTGGRA